MPSPARPSLLGIPVALGVICLLLVAFAQYELISKTTHKVLETAEDAIEDLDLDKPAQLFTRPHSKTQKGSFAGDVSATGSHSAGSVLSAFDKAHTSMDSSAGGHRDKQQQQEHKEKIGAGTLFLSQPSGMVLLLKRRSKHNDATYGLPGGNMDPEDQGDLVVTARREAVEEMGHLPSSYSIKGSILTRRGKHNQKSYTVFIAHVSDEIRQQYVPKLDPKEHSDYKWFPLKDLLRKVEVDTMVRQGHSTQAGAGGDGGGLFLSASMQGVDLHPVVQLVLEDNHKQELTRLTHS